MGRTIENRDRHVSLSRVAKEVLFSALLSGQLAILVGCGGTRSARIGQLNLAVTGQTITKVRASAGHIVVLEEKLTSISEDGPDRTLSILQGDGHSVNSYSAPPGWSVVDFAVHPSGDISVILTTATEVRIVRLDSRGALRSDELFLDSLSPNDPYFNYAGGIKNDIALQPALMHDAARLAPIGESLAVVLRTGRNAIVAYRVDPDASGAYTQSWRTLVEPGSSIFLLGITSGSFDVFGELQNHVRFFIDSDSNTLAIGLVNSPMRNFTFQAHSEFFNELIAASNGVLLTRVSVRDGHLLGSTAIDTRNLAELHGVRVTPRAFLLMGRVLSEIRSDGSGWDAFAATVKPDGSPGPYSLIDVDRGDVLFDVAPLPGGRYIALGSTGYIQNPSGESISESAQPLLALLNPDGSLAQRLNYTSGPRQNQLNIIAPLNGDWLLAGMVNGPGTHSGDADHNLIKADGFVRAGSDLPTK